MSFGHDDDRLISTDDDHRHEGEWAIAIALGCRFVFYVAIMTLLMMIVALIIKLLKSLNEESGGSGGAGGRAEAATETSRLISKEVASFSYGTSEEEEDVESGKSSSNSSGDLYDGKICVICYDQRRNCFFIPCGHCATCYFCAQRITEKETNTCPVCRRHIHRVRKLLLS